MVRSVWRLALLRAHADRSSQPLRARDALHHLSWEALLRGTDRLSGDVVRLVSVSSFYAAFSRPTCCRNSSIRFQVGTRRFTTPFSEGVAPLSW